MRRALRVFHRSFQRIWVALVVTTMLLMVMHQFWAAVVVVIVAFVLWAVWVVSATPEQRAAMLRRPRGGRMRAYPEPSPAERQAIADQLAAERDPNG